MGRGNNILYGNPLLLRKAKADFFSASYQKMPGRAARVFLFGETVVHISDDGSLSFLDRDIKVNGKSDWQESYHIDLNFPIFASSKSLVWADKKGVIIKNLDSNIGGVVLKEMPPGGKGEILGGHVSNNQLYLLSGDKVNKYLTLQSTSLRDDSGWELEHDYSSKKSVCIANKGNQSIFAHSEEGPAWKNGTISTMDQVGWIAATHPVGEELEEVIQSYRTSSWSDLLAASDNPKNLWYIKPREEAGVSLTPGMSISPRKTTLTERDMARGESVRTITLENSDEPVKLERMGGRLALLGKKSVSLITLREDGRAEEEIYFLKKKYSEMIWNGYEILLWNKGDKEYLSLGV